MTVIDVSAFQRTTEETCSKSRHQFALCMNCLLPGDVMIVYVLNYGYHVWTSPLYGEYYQKRVYTIINLSFEKLHAATISTGFIETVENTSIRFFDEKI
jgi:hypothetical protein